jgi:hypothetical protein
MSRVNATYFAIMPECLFFDTPDGHGYLKNDGSFHTYTFSLHFIAPRVRLHPLELTQFLEVDDTMYAEKRRLYILFNEAIIKWENERFDKVYLLDYLGDGGRVVKQSWINKN